MSVPSVPSPKLSASVILFRDGDQAPFEIFLLRRSLESSFMPGRMVFPGGGWQADDGDPGGDGLPVCALRELWEEAGVILADDPDRAAELDPEARERMRERVDAGELGLNPALAELGLVADLKALRPYARWITPLARPKRFDTIFYLARMPHGQRARSDEGETVEGIWLSPDRALELNTQGDYSLAPPQVRLIGQLAQASSADELWAEEPNLTPVLPILHADDSGRTIILPWDPDYQTGRPVREAKSCPAGQAERLIHRRGRWLPHRVE